jgi:DNA-binding transcriptional MerR regulator
MSDISLTLKDLSEVKRIKLEKESNKIGFYTIGDVSEKTGVKSYILRYWEKEFPFLQPVKNKAGHRLYTDRDVYIIKKIKVLLHEKGYSIPGAKKVLLEILLGKKSSKVNNHIEEIKKDLTELLKIIDRNMAKE